MKTTVAVIVVLLAAMVGPAAAKDFFGRVAHAGTVGLSQEQYASVTCTYACRSTMGHVNARLLQRRRP